eukprot:3399968-Prymnesium_polylepis.1
MRARRRRQSRAQIAAKLPEHSILGQVAVQLERPERLRDAANLESCRGRRLRGHDDRGRAYARHGAS